MQLDIKVLSERIITPTGATRTRTTLSYTAGTPAGLPSAAQAIQHAKALVGFFALPGERGMEPCVYMGQRLYSIERTDDASNPLACRYELLVA